MKREEMMSKILKQNIETYINNNYSHIDFEDLNIDIQNDATVLLRLKDSNDPWVMYQINRNGVYYGFGEGFETIYIIDNDKLSEYDIKK